MQLERHRIVDLDPVAWSDMLGMRPDLAAIPAVAEWATLGRPVIARGRLCSDDPGRVPLGLPLPPSMGKQRLAFEMPSAAIASNRPLPMLVEASRAGPVTWQATLAELVAIDPGVRCFGSLAWEHLTGLRYLSSTSDIDLLWHASSSEKADRLVAAIASMDAAAPMRIDGEIVAPGGSAVHWREWAGGLPDLLVKARDGNRIVARASLFA